MTKPRPSGKIHLAAAAACALALPGAAPAGDDGNFFARLAGDGGTVRFEYATAPDGSPARVRLSTGPDGVFEAFVATGSLYLETPDFRLRSLFLDYQPDAELLIAREEVRLQTDDVFAVADLLRYDIESGDMELTGSPDVTQQGPDSSTRFVGMETFVISTDEESNKDIRLRGPSPITISMQNAPDSEEPTGFAAFGETVTIVASPRTGISPMQPEVDSRVDEEGELVFFRAQGSVRLESDALNLRADDLVYDPVRNIVEALGSVFMRRENIEADAGRMVYDLASGQITLTIDPVVSQFSETSVTTISDIDFFIISQRPDGGTEVEYGSSEGPGSTEIRQIDPSERPAAAPPLPALPPSPVVEIDPTAPLQLP